MSNYFPTREEAREEAARRNARPVADHALRFAPVHNDGTSLMDRAYLARGDEWKLVPIKPTRQLPEGLRPQ